MTRSPGSNFLPDLTRPELTRRTALVTGASAGIGVALARELAQRGFDLVLVARRRERLEELAAEIQELWPVTAHVLPADLADPQSPRRIHDQLAQDHVTVDVLVNNAGYGINGSFTETTWKAQDDFLRVLLTSVLELTHLFLPGMKERGWGRVLNVASVAAFIPERPGDMYSPVKRFMVSTSRSLALELDGTGVAVTALCPGFTPTEFHDVLGTREQVNGLPSWAWTSAEFVAREGIDAMMKGKAVHVAGRLYRFLSWLAPLIPRRIAYALSPKAILARRDAAPAADPSARTPAP
jgi:short-subunit dehydrogenase